MSHAVSTPVDLVRSGEVPLEEAYAQCAAITRARARNFYFGLRLSPEPWRSAVFSVYAWMREADDIVDGDSTGATGSRGQLLDAFARQTERVLAGEQQAGGPAWWSALRHTVETWALPRGPFDELLLGMREDLGHDGYETTAELETYCHRVGSSTGRLCVAIWGLRDGVDPGLARELTDLRGVAFQRTNILRDIAADWNAPDRRSYVPADVLDRAGIDMNGLIGWREPERCRRVILQEAARAREAYERSAPLDEMIRPACAPVLRAMTAIYSGVLRCIERRPERAVLGPRASLPLLGRLSIAGRCLVAGRLGRAGSGAAR